MKSQSDLLLKMLGQNNELTEQVSELMQQNIALTKTVGELSERIEKMTLEVRGRICQ
jgi:hypothetical protein